MSDTTIQHKVYLILAEMVHGVSVMFGVDVMCRNMEEGAAMVRHLMEKDQGRRFQEVINLQVLANVAHVQCPRCEDVVAITLDSCCNCGTPMDAPEMVRAIKTPGRVYNRTTYEMKMLMDGSDNTYCIRPEHLVLYDFVPEDSRAYRKWAEISKLTIEKVKARRELEIEEDKARDEGRDLHKRAQQSGLLLPTPQDTVDVQRGKNARVQRG